MQKRKKPKVRKNRKNIGTCAFRTSCLKDISDVEFSFVCEEASGEQVEHIFERGALTKSDHWDTSVKCNKCLQPTMHHALVKAHEEETDSEKETIDVCLIPGVVGLVWVGGWGWGYVCVLCVSSIHCLV